MPIEILMPALSPTMTEGNLVKWHKKEGDKIKAGDIMVEIETDKATMEVEAVDEGTLGKILILDGTSEVKVNSAIGLLLEKGEDPAILENYQSQAAGSTEIKEEIIPLKEDLLEKLIHSISSPDRIFATPLAKRLAADKKIDLSHVQGSGPNGRILKRDVEEASPSVPYKNDKVPTGPAFRDVPVSTMRKVIAKRLVESKQTVPHFYLTLECCLDSLLQTRKSLNDNLGGVKLTVNDFIIKAVGLALRDTPAANASWRGDTIRYYTHSDVSVAVAIEDGLITPIIKMAALKPLTTISTEMKALAQKAKEGKLKPEEFQGGSFSISNLGMYGIKEFGAIINPPQACILAVGSGEPRAIVKDGKVEVATMMSCTLSVDHRVVDGKVGAELLSAFKKYIENPAVMLIGDF